MPLRDELEDAHGALDQLLMVYDIQLPRDERVDMVQQVRALFSVAMQTAEEEGEDDLLNRIQGLDHALEEAMNAPDNIMLELLESAENTSQNLVDSLGQMGGKRTHRKRTPRRKQTHRKRTPRRKQTHRKRTHRKRTHRSRK